MVRIINVKVKGNHLTKDSNNAGTRGEANVTTLRITFGEDWDSFEKHVVFRDAHGMNPTRRILTLDLLEVNDPECRTYMLPIPGEALGLGGEMSFDIEGYYYLNDGETKKLKRQRVVSCTLEVIDAPVSDSIIEPTPDQYTQMQQQYEFIKDDIETSLKNCEAYHWDTYNYSLSAAESAKEAGGYSESALSAKGASETAQSKAEEAQAGAESAKTDAETAQGKAEEAYDDFIEKRDETYNIIGDRVSQVEGYIEDVRKLKKQAEDAKVEALAYAENYDSLVEAVTQAENAKTFAVDNATAAYTFKEEALSAKETAEEAASSALASKRDASSSASYAGQHKTAAETAKTKAEEALSKAQAIQNNLTNALPAINNATQSANNAATSASNAKTYADNAENAVSQSRYIGSNGNWYVWDDSRKTFVDSGETAHAGSTVYVGSNPPSNAQVWIEPDDDSDIAMSIKEIYNTIKSMKPKAVTITLLSSAWVVDGDRYAQIVSIPEATAYSKVDLQPSAEQLTIFHEKDIAFVTENVGGTITVYCIGQKPTNDYTIQATITEVSK